MVRLFLLRFFFLQHLSSLLFELVEELRPLAAHLNELLEEELFIGVKTDLELVDQLLQGLPRLFDQLSLLWDLLEGK